MSCWQHLGFKVLLRERTIGCLVVLHFIFDGFWFSEGLKAQSLGLGATRMTVNTGIRFFVQVLNWEWSQKMEDSAEEFKGERLGTILWI